MFPVCGQSCSWALGHGPGAAVIYIVSHTHSSYTYMLSHLHRQSYMYSPQTCLHTLTSTSIQSIYTQIAHILTLTNWYTILLSQDWTHTHIHVHTHIRNSAHTQPLWHKRRARVHSMDSLTATALVYSLEHGETYSWSNGIPLRAGRHPRFKVGAWSRRPDPKATT